MLSTYNIVHGKALKVVFGHKGITQCTWRVGAA